MSFQSIQFFGLNKSSAAVALDPDAEAFLTATAITDTTITTAINNLVVGLKADSLWTKMKAVYPFVGGTATTHKFNLKDPRDLDAAFRLVFSGGITHDSTGVIPNGTNGYADTKLVPSTQLTNYDHHVSYFSRQVAGSNDAEIAVSLGGTSPGPTSDRIVFHVRWGDGNLYSDSYNYGNGRIAQSIAGADGFFIQTRTNSTSHKAYKDGTQVGSTNTNSSIGLLSTITGPIYLFATNRVGSSVGDYSEKDCSFASIGSGLSDTDAANFSTLVSNFQSDLGRSL